MVIVLVIIGVITIIVGTIYGINTGSFLGFMIAFFSGIAGSVIWFSMAKILENQSYILSQLQLIEEQIKKPPVKIICDKCGKEYEDSFSYCPHCANRPTKG